MNIEIMIHLMVWRKAMKTKKWRVMIFVIVCIMLAASICQNIWYYCYSGSWDSYLQDTDEIYVMESGILKQNENYKAGEDIKIEYDFSNAEYRQLIDKYGIDKTAGEGSELERALRLMDEYSPRLKHMCNYDNHIEINAMSLLEYSLDNNEHGINCRCKAQILNEMCMALGIYSRKVWIMPYSEYDTDCHVVNEVWDSSLNKWVMLDITNNQYWVDENGTPLSITEIREKGANQEFCTPIQPGDTLTDVKALKQKYIAEYLYIMKNMVYICCCENQTVGEVDSRCCLYPEGSEQSKMLEISYEEYNRSPIQ